MATLGSEYTNGDVQKGKWLNTTGGTTGNYWELIDEAIASANDADYIRGTGSGSDTSTETYIADLTAMPSDFLSMTSLSYNVRYRQFGRVDDTVSFTILVTNSAGTALTNTVTISNVTTTAFTNSGVTAFTLTTAGTTATKADWDAARLVIGQTYTASMTPDGAYIAISAIELTGDYTAFATVSRTGTSSGTGSSSNTGLVTRNRTASSSGTGSSSTSAVVARLRTATSSGAGSSSNTVLATRVRSASSSGTGSSASSRVITRLRTATGTGLGSSTTIYAQTVDRTASGTGVGSSSATWIRGIFVGPTTGSGAGSSSIVAVITRFRTASGSGSSFSVAIGARSALAVGYSSGYGDSTGATWFNGGRSLNEFIKLPPFWVDSRPKYIRRRR